MRRLAMPVKNAAKASSPKKKVGLGQAFWNQMKQAVRPLLCLDFDGTLVPHHRDRMSVRLSPATREALDRILKRDRTRLVIVTGRPAMQLPLLTSGLKVEVIGEQGWERMTPSGKMKRPSIDPEIKKVFAKAADRARRRGLGHRIEIKRSGIAVYSRGIPPSQANLLQCVAMAEWAPIAKEHNLSCQRFDGGVELRLPGHTKGSAVRAILEGHRKCDFVVYIGNDQTDVDALELVRDLGHPMAAGPSIADGLITNRFPGPDAVGEFLVRWAQIEESIPALPAGAPPPVVKAARPAPPGAPRTGASASAPLRPGKSTGRNGKAMAAAPRTGKGPQQPRGDAGPKRATNHPASPNAPRGNHGSRGDVRRSGASGRKSGGAPAARGSKPPRHAKPNRAR